MTEIVCPFCTTLYAASALAKCPNSECNEKAPAAYISACRERPPLWVVTVGFTRHGKTSLLAALTFMLERVRGAILRPLDQATQDAVRAMRAAAVAGADVLPNPPDSVPRPLLFTQDGLSGGPRGLVVYDVAGQHFDTLHSIALRVPALTQATTVWFLLSLTDMAKDEVGRSITDLFNVYLTGMQALGINVRGWTLILIYTKADMCDWPTEIQAYLEQDPLVQPDSAGSVDWQKEAEAYMESMRAVSDRLEQFTREQVPAGASVLALARSAGMRVVFTLASSRTDSGKGASAITPRRVLDPLLWSVSLGAPTPTRVYRLVVEASEGVSTSRVLEDVHAGLVRRRSAVSVYWLGRTAPVAGPGRLPKLDGAGAARPRLVVPLLASFGPEDRIVLVTSAPVLDLDDIDQLGWRERVYLVELETDHHRDWQRRWKPRPEADDVESFLAELAEI